MSRPIDIPGNQSAQAPRWTTPQIRREIPLPGGQPYYGFIEVCKDGHVRQMISAGGGRYVQIRPQNQLPHLAFIVEKNLVTNHIAIEVISSALRRTLTSIVFPDDEIRGFHSFDLATLLRCYSTLKTYSQRLASRSPMHPTALEMELLVFDVLVNQELYAGINQEHYVVQLSHLDSIHRNSISLGLDDMNDCFMAGLDSEEENRVQIAAFNDHFDHLARTGDYSGLQQVCEPLIISGHIEINLNPPSLLKVLDNGQLHVYHYLLSLIDRCRAPSATVFSPDLSDITLDPMYIAIRIGHLHTLQHFIDESIVFEGYTKEEGTYAPGNVLTPLSAAAFWDQPDLVQLLLVSGPLYSAGYQEAMAFALNGGLQDVVDILTHYGQVVPSSTPFPVYASFPSNPFPDPPSSWMSPGLTFMSQDKGTSRIGSLGDLLASESQPMSPSLLDLSQQSKSMSVNSWRDTSSPSSCYPAQVSFDADVRNGINQTVRSTTKKYGFPAGQSQAHQERRRAGAVLVQRLEAKRSQLLDLCLDDVEQSMMLSIPSAQEMWLGGVRGLENLLTNTLPTGLLITLQCLLVIDAVSWFVDPSEGQFDRRFLKNVLCWRTTLVAEDHATYDQIAHQLWDVTFAGASSVEADSVGLVHELISSILELESDGGILSDRSKRVGQRLHSIRGQSQGPKSIPTTHDSTTNPDFDLIDTSLRRLSMHDDQEEDDLEWNRFIHMDKLQSEPPPHLDQTAPTASVSVDSAAPTQGNASPVLELLTSRGFCAMLACISLLQHRSDKPFAGLTGCSGVVNSAYTMWTIFLNVPALTLSDLPHSYDRAAAPRISHTGMMKAAMKQQKVLNKSCLLFEPSLGSSASATSDLLCSSLSDLGVSSILSTSPETTRRIPCSKCDKTFSSVSNSNKHAREGCVYRNKKGFRCRNNECGKVLTTKWYRNTHEQRRCRFRQI